jgi:hypothetical protein
MAALMPNQTSGYAVAQPTQKLFAECLGYLVEAMENMVDPPCGDASDARRRQVIWVSQQRVRILSQAVDPVWVLMRVSAAIASATLSHAAPRL